MLGQNPVDAFDRTVGESNQRSSGVRTAGFDGPWLGAPAAGLVELTAAFEIPTATSMGERRAYVPEFKVTSNWIAGAAALTCARQIKATIAKEWDVAREWVRGEQDRTMVKITSDLA